MAVTGRTGADAIAKALHRCCIVITKFRNKLEAVIDAAVTAGAITSAQGVTAKDFVATAATVCSIFELIANYSGF